jgi:Flp pilus assembly protein TadD
MPYNAARLAPDDADVAALYGIALRDLDRLADAQRELIRAIGLDASRADSFTQLAQTYRLAGDRTQAARAFLRAATLQPQNAMAWRDAAESLRAAGEVDAAFTAVHHAASLAPEDPSIANTTALILHRQGHISAALATCERARSLATDDTNLALTRGMLLRTLDRYDEGWALYERRRDLPHLGQRGTLPSSPRWSGDALDGRHILVCAEQGLGDQVQFIRWASRLRAAGAAAVTVQVAPALARLLAATPHVDAVISTDATVPEHDAHVDLMSLPHLLQTGSDMLGRAVPYVTLPGEPPDITCHLPRPHAGVLRLGVAWAGTAQHADDWTRSMPLRGLLPAILHPSVQIVVLQQGAPRAELDALDPPDREAFIDVVSSCHDMACTAALMAQCDAVLTVDTALAHVAGALGLPVWIMVAHPAEWRWGRDRTTVPAYPSARLFRQYRGGVWTDVVNDVRAHIAQWLDARPAALQPTHAR